MRLLFFLFKPNETWFTDNGVTRMRLDGYYTSYLRIENLRDPTPPDKVLRIDRYFYHVPGKVTSALNAKGWDIKGIPVYFKDHNCRFSLVFRIILKLI